MGRSFGSFKEGIHGDKLHIKGQKPIQLYLTKDEMANPPKEGYEYTGKNPNDE
jgi:hypothetical protein